MSRSDPRFGDYGVRVWGRFSCLMWLLCLPFFVFRFLLLPFLCFFGLGSGVWVLGSGVWSLGCGVCGLESEVWSGVWGLRFLESEVWGLGQGVWSLYRESDCLSLPFVFLLLLFLFLFFPFPFLFSFRFPPESGV